MNGLAPQQAHSVILALSHADDKGVRQPSKEQKVPAYSGFQSCYHLPHSKSKPYYHTPNEEPPSKSVMNDIMVKVVAAMRQKRIPFSFFVGDMPTYMMITQI